MSMQKLALLFSCVVTFPAFGDDHQSDHADAASTGSVIFFHPDGTGLNHWAVARAVTVGPDGRTNWDQLPAMAVYVGHMKDSLTATSHGGATVHAYGVKVHADSFGLDKTAEIVAASGQKRSIMEEAMEAGMPVGIVNSGSIIEPGTAVFVASAEQRGNHEEISAEVIESGADIIMSGGEALLLPSGEEGRHGEGRRGDGRNLIEEAEEAGYTVVYNRNELLALPASTDKVLGVFSAGHTFNALQENVLKQQELPLYEPDAPTIGEMTRKALEILHAKGKPFFLVAEEEGTDNFGNYNNAPGTVEALKRADETVGIIRDYIAENPQTMLIMAADSDAGGMQLLGFQPESSLYFNPDEPVMANVPRGHGAPLDGSEGPETEPFISAPDANGREHPFAIAWATYTDTHGGILARADGLNADQLHGTIDNTEVYDLMYFTLFGERPKAGDKGDETQGEEVSLSLDEIQSLQLAVVEALRDANGTEEKTEQAQRLRELLDIEEAILKEK